MLPGGALLGDQPELVERIGVERPFADEFEAGSGSSTRPPSPANRIGPVPVISRLAWPTAA